MLKKFNSKRTQILQRLSTPDLDYVDASPKGSVDEGIRKLVEEINSTPGFVTTSSCAGRIAVFLEGAHGDQTSTSSAANKLTDDGSLGKKDSVMASTGGKGGGKWLFTSHSPIDVSNLSNAGALFQRLVFHRDAEVSFPSPDARPQYIRFKFEPMILHILTSSAEKAQEALNAAMAAGFRESGISSLMDSKSRPTPPIVAVRSSGIALESIIGFQSPDSSRLGIPAIQPMVSEAYLQMLVQVANERFKVNEERKVRFREAFVEQTLGMCASGLERGEAGRHSFESAAARRERKRREGLLRREEMLAYGGSLDGVSDTKGSQDGDLDDEDYGVGVLMEDGDQEETIAQDSDKQSIQNYDVGYL